MTPLVQDIHWLGCYYSEWTTCTSFQSCLPLIGTTLTRRGTSLCGRCRLSTASSLYELIVPPTRRSTIGDRAPFQWPHARTGTSSSILRHVIAVIDRIQARTQDCVLSSRNYPESFGRVWLDSCSNKCSAQVISKSCGNWVSCSTYDRRSFLDAIKLLQLTVVRYCCLTAGVIRPLLSITLNCMSVY